MSLDNPTIQHYSSHRKWLRFTFMVFIRFLLLVSFWMITLCLILIVRNLFSEGILP